MARPGLAWTVVAGWGASFGLLLVALRFWPAGALASVLGFVLAFSLLAATVVTGPSARICSGSSASAFAIASTAGRSTPRSSVVRAPA